MDPTGISIQIHVSEGVVAELTKREEARLRVAQIAHDSQRELRAAELAQERQGNLTSLLLDERREDRAMSREVQQTIVTGMKDIAKMMMDQKSDKGRGTLHAVREEDPEGGFCEECGEPLDETGDAGEQAPDVDLSAYWTHTGIDPTPTPDRGSDTIPPTPDPE